MQFPSGVEGIQSSGGRYTEEDIGEESIFNVGRAARETRKIDRVASRRIIDDHSGWEGCRPNNRRSNQLALVGDPKNLITQGRHAIDGSGGEQEVASFLNVRPGRRAHVVDTVLIIGIGTCRLAQPVDRGSGVRIQLIDDVADPRLWSARRFVETSSKPSCCYSKEIGSARCTQACVGKGRKDHPIADRISVGVLGLSYIEGSVGIDVPSPGDDSRVGNSWNGKTGISNIDAEELPCVGIGDQTWVLNPEAHCRPGWRYGHVTRVKAVSEDIFGVSASAHVRFDRTGHRIEEGDLTGIDCRIGSRHEERYICQGEWNLSTPEQFRRSTGGREQWLWLESVFA